MAAAGLFIGKTGVAKVQRDAKYPFVKPAIFC